jgi:hypothetical protein
VSGQLANVSRRSYAKNPELLAIRQNHGTGERSLDLLRWGLIPYWCDDPKGGRRPINAKCETVRFLRISGTHTPAAADVPQFCTGGPGRLTTCARVSRIAVLTVRAKPANSCKCALIFFPLARRSLARL